MPIVSGFYWLRGGATPSRGTTPETRNPPRNFPRILLSAQLGINDNYNYLKMKVTLILSDFQLMKALALTPANEEQTEKIMSAVRETPELDITHFLSVDEDYKQVSFVIAVAVLATISEKYKIE